MLLMDTSESVIFYDLEMSRKHWAYQFHNQRHSMHVRHCGKDVDVGDIPGALPIDSTNTAVVRSFSTVDHRSGA
ncbi:hypothetical protein FDU21_20570 [Xanthomonas oryzae pv. oryzae]|nr:hypothetical protein FDU21_20570 [Xanthomonas oryzae pv. oryzae]